eukprot:5134257-Pyramimonas_sp.AAC.1
MVHVLISAGAFALAYTVGAEIQLMQMSVHGPDDLEAATLRTDFTAQTGGTTWTDAAPLYCLQIVTGTGSSNQGSVDVSVDVGSGLVQEASGVYAQGATVLSK